MKRLVALTFGLCVLAGMTFAGFKDAELSVVPTTDLDGGMAVMSIPFGHGASPKMWRADPVGGDVSIRDEIISHLDNNWGKYLAVLGTAGTYLAYAHNNREWPFDKGNEDSIATFPATGGEGITGPNITGNDNRVGIYVSDNAASEGVVVNAGNIKGDNNRIEIQIGDPLKE